LLTTGHTQLPGRGVANVGSFGYLSGNPTESTLKRQLRIPADVSDKAKKQKQ
jgi:hypothetical protein